MSDGRFEKMLGAVIGYTLRVEQWRGTRKLSQNKPVDARVAAAQAMADVGDHAIAALMRSALQ